MTDFPDSAAQTKELAFDLVRHLRAGIKNTNSRKEWTNRNIRLLDGFCRTKQLTCDYHRSVDGPEFLWDFVGYIADKGILITAESEHDVDRYEIAKDFDKLLYGSSPIKLMICRIDKATEAAAAFEEAEKIRVDLETGIKGSCAHYPPGSAFIVYCVWWAEEGGPNRDFPYILQIDGEPHYVSVRPDQHFERLPE